MAKKIESAVLSMELLDAIAVGILPTTPAPEVASRIKSKLMVKIEASKDNHRFMFAEEGVWHTVAEGVEVKILRQEAESRSVLVKMAANSILPSHQHAFDEEALILEGDVWVEGILCHVGDYHHAHAGGSHQDIHTTNGCLLFIRNA